MRACECTLHSTSALLSNEKQLESQIDSEQNVLTVGELSAADLPPEGDGEQSSGFDISIDVFPRLHERDPYRYAHSPTLYLATHRPS